MACRSPHFLFLRFVVALLAPLAHAASGKRSYQLSAGDAAETLRQFIAQSGAQVFYLAPTVKGVKTHPVVGEFTALEAIQRMTTNTGLVVVQDRKSGAFMLHRVEPADPPATGAPVHPPDPDRPGRKSGKP